MLLIILVLPLFNSYEFMDINRDGIEILVARYNEDLEWLKDEPFNKYPVTIYNKGENDYFYKPPLLKKIVNLNNVGVCVHSYLYHITDNYENLANVTIFLPGSCVDKIKKEKTINTIDLAEKTKNSVFFVNELNTNVATYFKNYTLENYPSSNDENRKLNPLSNLRPCEIRPFGNWYEHFFPNIDVNHVNFHGIFAVSKEHILNRSKNSYIELLNQVNKDKNEESAHYFERAFIAVFHPVPKESLYNI